MKRALGLFVLCAASSAFAQANTFYWPVANTNAPVCAYVDNNGKDWKCGSNRYAGHKGTDISVGVGNGVLAGTAGQVISRVDGCPYGSLGNYCGGGAGNSIGLWHGSGVTSIYMHMTSGSGLPASGANVSCGQRIGATGSSGNSSGPHLHFQVQVGASSSSAYSGYADDPFAGACGGPTSFWKSQGTGYVPSCGPGAPSPQSASSCGAPACPAGTYALYNCNAAGTARVRCTGGNVQTEQCPNGCQVNAIGVEDTCKPATCPAGTYDLWNCNAAGTERTRCVNGAAQTEPCANGCQVNPNGTDDVCKPAPVCPAGTFALWNCNDARTDRVRCVNGQVETQRCNNGCTVMPNGADDVCAAPSCPAGSFALWTCNEAGTERERCINGTVQKEACANGCQANASGADDACLPPPSCPSTLGSTFNCNAAGTTRERCVAGQVEQEQCPHGCDSTEPGDAVCQAPTPCAEGVTSAFACTKDGTAKSRCVNGVVEQQRCEAGCAATDAGEAFCAASRCPPNVTDDWSCSSEGRARVRCGAEGFELQVCDKGCVSDEGVSHCRGAPVCEPGVLPKWTCSADATARRICTEEGLQTQVCATGCEPRDGLVEGDGCIGETEVATGGTCSVSPHDAGLWLLVLTARGFLQGPRRVRPLQRRAGQAALG